MFELVYGLRINLGKSNIIGVGLEAGVAEIQARKMGCGVGKIPFS